MPGFMSSENQRPPMPGEDVDEPGVAEAAWGVERRAVEVRRPGEELGDLHVLVPGRRRREVPAVFRLEVLLLGRIVEEVLAVGHLEHVAVVHQRVGLAVALDDRILVDGDVVVADLGIEKAEVGIELLQESERDEVSEEIGREDEEIVGGGARRQLRHQLLVLADEGQADHLDVGAEFALHGVGVPAERIFVLARRRPRC